jgi:hypothetical protein
MRWGAIKPLVAVVASVPDSGLDNVSFQAISRLGHPSVVLLLRPRSSANQLQIIHPRSLNSASDAPPHFPLSVNDEPLKLEDLDAGQSARTSLAVLSSQETPVRLERIETSFPCVKVGPVPVQIDPGSTTALTVTFDASGEPDFRGKLSVNIVGYTEDGSVGFMTHLAVYMRPKMSKDKE